MLSTIFTVFTSFRFRRPVTISRLSVGLCAAITVLSLAGLSAQEINEDDRLVAKDTAAFQQLQRHFNQTEYYNSIGKGLLIAPYVDSVLNANQDWPAGYRFDLLSRKAYYCYATGDYDTSLATYEKIYQFTDSVPGYDGLKNACIRGFAACYDAIEMEDMERLWTERGIAFCRERNMMMELAVALWHYGDILMVAGDYERAIEEMSEGRSLLTDTTVLFYTQLTSGLLEAHVLSDKIDDPEVNLLIRHLAKVIEHPKSIQHRGPPLIAMIKYHTARGNYEQAVANARLLVADTESVYTDTDVGMTWVLKHLYPAEALAGNYDEAYNTLLRYHNAIEARHAENQKKSISQTAVSVDLHDHELARIAAENQIALEQQSSAQRTRLFALVFATSALLLLIIGRGYYRSRRDTRLIAEKNSTIEESLTEKDMLLREIHHRVKNNLQIISSLLEKQARKSVDSQVQTLVREGQARIQSMALIHQNLYESELVNGINVKSYLNELTENIRQSHSEHQGIELDFRVADIVLDIDTAIPVGLILNELLTNSFKYAFGGRQRGKIIVDLQRDDEGNCFMRVGDDGSGFDATGSVDGRQSLGLNLVRGLVRQLRGSFEWLDTERGAVAAINFPLRTVVTA